MIMKTMQESEVDDAELGSIDETTIKPQTWPTLPPPPITTTSELDNFDLDSGIPSDSASLLFLNNPNLILDEDLESEQIIDEEVVSNASDEDVNEDVPSSVENRNRVLQVKLKNQISVSNTKLQVICQ